MIQCLLDHHNFFENKLNFNDIGCLSNLIKLICFKYTLLFEGHLCFNFLLILEFKC